MSILHQLSRPALIGLAAAALETGRLVAPYYAASLTGIVPAAMRNSIATELQSLQQMGMTATHIVYTLRLLAQERKLSQSNRDSVELVWSGEEVVGSSSRDTSVVVRELFNTAQSSILISSFAVDKGEKARGLFGTLAERMDINPNLSVRMFLNVKRPHNSQQPDSIILREFATTFRQEIWFGERLPSVFYDPRSLAMGGIAKACLHAKCVVVDEERLLVTSANFTEAAHKRNIEAGVLITDPIAAKAMVSQFETLVTRNILIKVPGI
jgi:phosphatidylserine/phosphatidylglycerophosphate/cardiolipin synthase-like enzyme